MTCDRIEDLLAAFVDGDLAGEERACVEDHLRTCSGCAELVGLLRTAAESLALFPEVEPSPRLREKLRAIPVRETGFRRFRRFFLTPALQPVFAAASFVLVLFSLYMFNPDKQHVDEAVSRAFHRGVGTFEKFAAQAGTITDTLGGYAENALVSLEKINPLKQSEERPK